MYERFMIHRKRTIEKIKKGIRYLQKYLIIYTIF